MVRNNNIHSASDVELSDIMLNKSVLKSIRKGTIRKKQIMLKVKKSKSLSHVQLFATPQTIQSLEFSRPEYWSGLPFASPRNLPNPGIKPRSPALQVDSLPAEP